MSGSSLNTILNLIRQQEGKCYYCGKNFISSNEEFSLDHLMPSSRGGQTIESNLAICCISCNEEKANMTEEEYWRYLSVKKLLTDAKELVILKDLFTNKYSTIQDLNDDEIIELCHQNWETYFNYGITSRYCRELEKSLMEQEEIDKAIVDINAVSVYALFLKNYPKKQKIEKAKSYYLLNKKIDKPIKAIVNGEKIVLVDGYSRYCALKELGIKYVPVNFHQYGGN